MCACGEWDWLLRFYECSVWRAMLYLEQYMKSNVGRMSNGFHPVGTSLNSCLAFTKIVFSPSQIELEKSCVWYSFNEGWAKNNLDLELVSCDEIGKKIWVSNRADYRESLSSRNSLSFITARMSEWMNEWICTVQLLGWLSWLSGYWCVWIISFSESHQPYIIWLSQIVL